jgi:ketosteroid isomerase-like protein
MAFEDNVFVSREAWRRFNHGDFAGTIELIHPEAEFQDFPGVDGAGWNHGRDGGVRFGVKLQEAFDDFKVHPFEFYEHGDEEVLSFGRATGRGRRSGVPVELEWAAMIRVRDGLAQRIALWQTRAGLLAAAGLTEHDLLLRRYVHVAPADADYPHEGPLRPLTDSIG